MHLRSREVKAMSTKSTAKGSAGEENMAVPKKRPAEDNASEDPPRSKSRIRLEKQLERELDKMAKLCAAQGQNQWNDECKEKGVGEYELVEAVTCGSWDSNNKSRLEWRHANFTARPKDDPESEAELFFVELTKPTIRSKKFVITKLSNLGPAASVTSGRNGCLVCISTGKHLLHHPPPGEFNAGCRGWGLSLGLRSIVYPNIHPDSQNYPEAK